MTKIHILFQILIYCIPFQGKSQNQQLRFYDAESGFEIKEFKKRDITFKYTLNKISDTVKIWTTDSKFITDENYKIGTKLNEISPVLKKQIYKLPGNGYFIRLPSGWLLAFCEGKSCTDEIPNESSQVKWIVKR